MLAGNDKFVFFSYKKQTSSIPRNYIERIHTSQLCPMPTLANEGSSVPFMQQERTYYGKQKLKKR